MEGQSTSLNVIDLGLIEYKDAYKIQQEILQNRRFGEVPDTLLLAEHPPVITIGRSGSRKNVLIDEGTSKKKGVSIFEIDRGGDVTYHGPGQLVAYPIMDIKGITDGDIHKFLRGLEEVIIRFLSCYQITGSRVPHYTGVWVGDKKIASIGIGVRRWISYHGLALNINPDMSHFSMINPCGLVAAKMTSMEECLGRAISVNEVKRNFIESFSLGISKYCSCPDVTSGLNLRCFVTEVEVKRFPPWLKKKLDVGGRDVYTREVIDSLSLHTVCDSAKCPNINECFSRGTATFLILGNVCTRNCGFCAVDSGVPEGPDYDEALRVAGAAKRLNLRHVVITSVTRDDLEDGGASHFAATIRDVRAQLPLATIEVLTPDFNGKKEAIRKVLEAEPTIFNHNVETVPRLYKRVRAGADYERSLSVLRYAREDSPELRTKSGLMLGMGEEKEEVVDVLEDLRAVGCDMLTIGQYLKPSNGKLEVFRFVHPDEFKEYADLAKALGFRYVASAPFVRSSYCADQWLE